MLRKILTADRTESFLNENIQETYHSQTGAVEEALKKYAIPCKIKELAGKGTVRILDMFFGLGYNSAMAIDVALQANPRCEIEIIGVENDLEIIKKMQEVNPPIHFFKHYKKIKPGALEFVQGRVRVKVLLGDARKATQQLQGNHFDAVFYDPFSPKTSPELWSEELFAEMWRVMKPTAILATYSCARLGRESMSKAGLVYDDGPIVGRRGPGTIATKWMNPGIIAATTKNKIFKYVWY